MSDSFFGFDTSHVSDDDLGPPDLDDDRYNSETFGADAGEWEEDDHEKIAAYLERERSALHQLGNGHSHGLAAAASELPTAIDIERGLSKLVTDDELDDPCNMAFRRSNRNTASVAIPHPQFGRPRSPPISTLIEPDISGSPSTNSIWSTTPTRPANAFDDPAIMSLGRPRAPPPPGRLPPPTGIKVRTVEELEQDLLSRAPARPAAAAPPPGFGRGLPPSVDFSRPPPMRLPPPGGLAGPGGPGQRFRLPNTQLPPPSVTSILPPQLMNKDRGGTGGARGLGAGRGASHHHHNQQRHQHQQQQWRQDQDRRRQDPYAGLMTARERQWLLNIQRMQIKGNTDYYFQHFNSRKLSQGRRDSRGGHGRDQQRDDKHTDHRLYKPPEMENSLGKLQVASVTAPRKIIDLGVINQESADGGRDHKEAKRDRQTLLLIEQLYQQVMLMEDADRKAAGEVSSDSDSPESAAQLPASPEEVRAAAGARLWAVFSREQRLVQILSIRKGKGLVLRCILVLTNQQYYQIATTLLKNLVVILHKDKTDHMLHKFYVCMQMVISNSDLSQITELTSVLTASTDLDSATPGKTPLQVVASSPFGVSVMVLLLLRGDQLSQQASSAGGDGVAGTWRELSSGLVRCLTALPTLAPPLETLPAALLAKHLHEPRLVTRLSGDATAT